MKSPTPDVKVPSLALTPAEIKGYYVERDVKTVEFCIEKNFPVLLVGETGVGKTTLIRAIAKEQKKELVRVSMNGSMGTEELLGKRLLENGETKWLDGILTDAVRTGKWIVLDEINSASADILFALHALLDEERALVLPEKDNERIEAHPEFRLFGGMNPEEYVGTKLLNQAFKSRFYIVNVHPLSPGDEAKFLERKLGLVADVAAQLVSVGQALRAMKHEQKIVYFCSTRDLEMAGSLLSALSFEDAMGYAVFNKMPALDIEEIMVAGTMTQFVNRYKDALKAELAELRELKKEVDEFKKARAQAIQLKKEIEELQIAKKGLEEAKGKLEGMQAEEIFLHVKRMQSDPLYMNDLEGIDALQFAQMLAKILTNAAKRK